MNFRDVELLSAYLDGRLNPSESARLEARLSSEPNLKATLEDLRQTRGLLRRLPQRRAPRDFRLTPKMAGIRPPAPRAYPAFRFATALTAFLFVAAVALNAITPFAAPRLAAAPAPAFGKGGGSGGGGGPSEFTAEAPLLQAPAATEAPAATQAPFAALAPTATPEAAPSIAQATAAAPQAEDATRASGAAPNPEANQTGPAGSAPQAETTRQPVPLPWVIGLGIVMLMCAAAAGVLRINNERQVRERWNKK
jgi:hypothetical protein